METSQYAGAPFKSAKTLYGLNPITNNHKMQVHQWPSIGMPVQQAGIPLTGLGPNIGYRLGLTI